MFFCSTPLCDMLCSFVSLNPPIYAALMVLSGISDSSGNIAARSLKSKLGLLTVWSQWSHGDGLERLKHLSEESGLNIARPYHELGRNSPRSCEGLGRWLFCGMTSWFSWQGLLCVHVFEVIITLSEAFNHTVTKAQPLHEDYGCWLP